MSGGFDDENDLLADMSFTNMDNSPFKAKSNHPISMDH